LQVILDSLKDRRPDLFPAKPVVVRNPRRGEGKRRIAAARAQHYVRGILALLIRPALLAAAALEKDRADQLAQTGGIESAVGPR
jgi:hypothetical protein